MQFMSRVFSCATLAAASIGATGCADPGPTLIDPDTGFLTVEWTIGGVENAGRCEEFGVASFRFEIFDEDGFWIADRTVPCDNFTLGMRLWAGSYYAQASLLGETLAATVLERVDVAVVVPSDEEVTIEVDFPTGTLSPTNALAR